MAESGASLFNLASAQAQNKADTDTFGSLFSAIASGLETGMNSQLELQLKRQAQQQQIEMEQELKRKNQQQEMETLENLFNAAQSGENKTNAGVLNKIGSDDSVANFRGLKVNKSKAILNVAAGKSVPQAILSSAQSASERKAGRELNAQDNYTRDLEAFNSGTLSMNNLILNNPTFFGEERVLQAAQAGRVIPQQSGTPIPSVQSPNVIPNESNLVQENVEFDELGFPKATKLTDLNATAKIKKQEDKLEAEKNISAGRRAAFGNLELVSGALSELSNVYVEGFREGGIGNIAKKYLGNTAIWAGGGIGDQFDDTAAFDGQKTETVARIMPILTQQGEKPGSVRLVETIFRKVAASLPDRNTSPKGAKRQMGQTLRNMYRFARASQLMDVTDEQFESMSPDQQAQATARLEQIASRVQLGSEEEQQIDALLKNAFPTLDALIDERGGTASVTQQQKDTYNQLRASGVSPNEARQQAGF